MKSGKMKGGKADCPTVPKEMRGGHGGGKMPPKMPPKGKKGGY